MVMIGFNSVFIYSKVCMSMPTTYSGNQVWYMISLLC